MCLTVANKSFWLNSCSTHQRRIFIWGWILGESVLELNRFPRNLLRREERIKISHKLLWFPLQKILRAYFRTAPIYPLISFQWPSHVLVFRTSFTTLPSDALSRQFYIICNHNVIVSYYSIKFLKRFAMMHHIRFSIEAIDN